MTALDLIAGLVILVTLLGVAIGRYPVLRMNRATIALVGATLLVLIGAIPLEQAYAALDLNTVILLFAMMVININLRLAGFFHLVANRIIRWAHSPRQLLAFLIFFSGILSAVFLNDTIVIMFTPLVVEIVLALRRNPLPYLVGLVSAANIGSTMTIIGNPQNMIIGLASKIPFLTFTACLAPVALAGMAVAWLVLVLVYRREFVPQRFLAAPVEEPRLFRPLLRKSALAAVLTVGIYAAGAPIPLAALSGASFLLVTRRIKPARVFRELDWSLLVFFSALFIATHALETTGLVDLLFRVARPIAEHGTGSLTAVAVVLSNLVSNVPAVLLFRPLVPHFAHPQQVWLTLAMATTLAGNLTLLGSVANLIAAETAKHRGVRLGFLEYLKAGVPITLVTLVLGALWLTVLF